MKLTLAEPRYIKESISIISDLVNEAQIKITKDGVELIAMDPANVAMVIFKLLSTTFIEYDVKKDHSIGINLSNFKQILRRAGANDTVSLELSEDSKLKIQLKGRGTRTFSLPLIDLDSKEQKIPSLEFSVVIKSSASLLSETIADADVVGESVAFIGEKDQLTVRSEGDLADANIEIKNNDGITIQIKGDESEEKVLSRYSIEYLKKMITAQKLADDVSIQFSGDYPLKLEYNEMDKLSLAFILAPRVEND